jgi:hypothetical protein
VDEGVHWDEKLMTIVAGSDDPANPIPRKKRKFVQKEKIDSVKIHPLYKNPAARYDLALVKIKGQFTFRNTRWPICIPEKTESRDHSRKGHIMLGFGRNKNKDNSGSVLTQLDLDVQPTYYCSSTYGEILSNENDKFYTKTKNTLPENFDGEDSLLCASKLGRDSGSCPGDSGGILMRQEFMLDSEGKYRVRAIQTAVVHGSAQDCKGDRYPSIFNRIDGDALSWINSIAFPTTRTTKTTTTTRPQVKGMFKHIT